MILFLAVLIKLVTMKTRQRREEERSIRFEEASVREANEIKFKTLDELYEHWMTCVQPDNSKILAVETEDSRSKKNGTKACKIIAPDARNGVVDIAPTRESEALPPLDPPIVPPVVRRDLGLEDDESVIVSVETYPELRNH